MRKRLCALGLLLLLLLPLCLTTAAADLLFWPETSIQVIGGSQEAFTMTLLGETDTTDPTDWENLSDRSDYVVLLPYLVYEDEDDFHFLLTYDVVDETPYEYSWQHDAPEVFKVLLYFPDQEEYAVTPIYKTYAFHTAYVLDLSTIEDGQVSLQRQYDLSGDLMGLVVRTLFSICVELLLALPFLYWTGETLPVILLVNLFTQLMVNCGLSVLIFYRGGRLIPLAAVDISLSLVAFVIESTVYQHKFPAASRRLAAKPVLYALTANLASFLAGIALWNYCPYFF